MSDRIKVITEKCEGKKVLDIGCCGSNYHLHKKISEASEKVVGIDMDEEKVKEMNRKGYEVYYRNAEEFDLGEKFQVVVAGELIEHLENPGTFLDSVKEHLVKKGKLILTTPNLQSAWIIKQNFCGSEGNKNHILGFTGFGTKM